MDVARFAQKTSLDEVLKRERDSGILIFGTVARISVYKSEKWQKGVVPLEKGPFFFTFILPFLFFFSLVPFFSFRPDRWFLSFRKSESRKKTFSFGRLLGIWFRAYNDRDYRRYLIWMKVFLRLYSRHEIIVIPTIRQHVLERRKERKKERSPSSNKLVSNEWEELEDETRHPSKFSPRVSRLGVEWNSNRREPFPWN